MSQDLFCCNGVSSNSEDEISWGTRAADGELVGAIGSWADLEH